MAAFHKVGSRPFDRAAGQLHIPGDGANRWIALARSCKQRGMAPLSIATVLAGGRQTFGQR